MTTLALRASVLAVVMSAGMAFADVTIEGDTYPCELNISGHTLKLRGVGLREKWWFNVYTVGVYLKTYKEKAWEIVNSNQPKFLWLKMQRTISKEKMDDAVDEGLKKNTAEEKIAGLKDRFETFKKAFPESIKKKLQMGFTYLPGKGTIVRIGNEEKGVIPGKDFMRALWRIWFWKRPADKDLKKSVLKGTSCGK